MTNKIITALRRRLEKWELEHLRSVAAELHQSLEQRTRELERAEELADFWWQTSQDLQQSLSDRGAAVGISADGYIGVLNS